MSHYKLTICMNTGVSFYSDKHGRIVRQFKITGRERSLLQALASRVGCVVASDELMSAVWLGKVVKLNTLKACASRLKSAINDIDCDDVIRAHKDAGYALDIINVKQLKIEREQVVIYRDDEK